MVDGLVGEDMDLVQSHVEVVPRRGTVPVTTPHRQVVEVPVPGRHRHPLRVIHTPVQVRTIIGLTLVF